MFVPPGAKNPMLYVATERRDDLRLKRDELERQLKQLQVQYDEACKVVVDLEEAAKKTAAAKAAAAVSQGTGRCSMHV